MKRSERHHLKENELSVALADASARFTRNSKWLRLSLAIVALLLIGGGGYWAWQARAERLAGARLGEALMIAQSPVQDPTAAKGITPPPGTYPTFKARTEAALAKFTEVFTAYPSTSAGLSARYHAASALALLGRPAEAVTRYQEVIDRDGTANLYGRMAQLGLIEAQTQAKQFDQAISRAEALANSPVDSGIPRDAILMELGRAYAAAGKKAEAKQTFDKVVVEFPDSVYVSEAKELISTLT
jgi:tetratricopeptide (TPR) repeat protein